MTSTTRRISITSEQLQNDALRAQLFSACCAYGLVEWLRYDEDPNYNTTTVRIQFQKLSSADRLRSDVHQRGQAWQVESEAAAPCVGSDVLLSSSDAVTCARLKSLLPALQCTELSGVGGSVSSGGGGAGSAADPVPTASMATFEEKSFLLHGRGTTTTTTTARTATASAASSNSYPSSSRVTAEQEAALWSGFEQQSSALRHSCLGSYCAVLHLASAHDANEFLLQHQLHLAERHGVYATHVGTTATSPLAAALPKMLSRHALAERPVDGRVVRGYVVAMPSNTYCVVDAGLYPSSEQAGASTLVNTHTNFLDVSIGDEVQVQLSTGGGLSIAGEGMVGGKLLRVLVAAAFSTRRAVAKVQLPTTAARTLRTSNLARGLLSAAATAHKQGPKPPAPPNLVSALKRNATTAVGTRPANGVRPMSSGSARVLAGKLFKHIQERKKGAADGAGASAERICTYPAGLSVYTRLLVRVERIEDDGLHARCVADEDNCGYTGPVFIPAALVPSEATPTMAGSAATVGSSSSVANTTGSGEGWRTYAVVGERMHVALLYMVAVGGSAATMRGVASKKEADLRRAAVAATAAREEVGLDEGEGSVLGETSSSAVVAGTSVTAVAMLLLSEGDLGVPSSSAAHAGTFPAYLLRAAGAHASAALRQTPLLLPVADLGPLDPSALTTSPATLTISEMVNDVSRGQYAVVVPYALYAARQAERAAAQERKKKAEVDEVKRRLAAVMGDDILDVLNDDDDNVKGTEAKRQRREG